MIAPKQPKPTPAESRRAYRVVAERSKGICEGCGKKPASQFHHRLFRSRGGKDTVPNLMHLCADVVGGNVDGCHGLAYSASPPAGWAVHSWESPELVPVTRYGIDYWLTSDGKAVPVGEDVEF